MFIEAAADRPLTGVRVLDLATGSLGAAARILAELGADVVRIQPPGGGNDRGQGPRVGDLWLGFAVANVGKRTATLDFATPEGRALFDALAAQADIVIESTRPGTAEAAAVGGARLLRRHAGLVIVSIPDFGAGTMTGWKASDGVIHALSGLLARSGIAGREPVLPPGDMAIKCAADHAAYGALIGYYNRLLNGVGDHIEIGVLDAATQSLDPGYGIAGSANAGVPNSMAPRGRPNAAHFYPVIACCDGYVRLCILAARQWQGMFEWMGSPPAFADPALRNLRARHANLDLMPAMGRFLADKTRDAIEHEAARHGVPAAALLSLEEVIASDHIREREAIARVEIAPGIHASFVNGVLAIDGRRAGIMGPPAPAGGSAEEVLRQWSAPRPHAPVPARGGDPARPLAGLRVLDLGIIVVGAEQGRLLADFGADVIKVENEAFPDGSRATSPALLPLTFAAGHRNKRGLGLNLRQAEGRELLLALVDRADVILANFKPGTLESLGLGADVLLARNPRVILAESSAFGNSGAWGGRMGYGPLVRATAGLTQAWRYADDPASFSDAATAYPDHIASRIGIAGVLALLIRRMRTDKGGTIAVAQTEVMLSQFGDEIAALSLKQASVAVEGAPKSGAPNGVYPCAGDDEWCVISVRSEPEWQSLCTVMGRADLALDQALSNLEARAAQGARIDGAISEWTQTLPPQEVMQQLQAADVAAGMMLRVSELPDFAYFSERGFFETLDQQHLERPIMVDNLPLSSKQLQRPPLGPAPLLGEHTVDVISEILGLDTAEIDRLLGSGALEQWRAKENA